MLTFIGLDFNQENGPKIKRCHHWLLAAQEQMMRGGLLKITKAWR